VGRRFSHVITIEDGTRAGGMGSAVLEFMDDHDLPARIHRLGLPDEFVEHGSVEELYRIVGLDKDSIVREIKRRL
jgi:1-deoxy-D-xylulose-5-phosphate synthase